MSNREDYLDSLLKSVTDREEESELINSEDEFLAEYDQEMMKLDDDFLKEYEKELDDGEETGIENQFAGDADLDDILVDTMKQSDLDDMLVDTIGLEESDDMVVNTMDESDLSDMPEDDFDAMLMSAIGEEPEAEPEPIAGVSDFESEPLKEESLDEIAMDDDEDVDDAELLEILAGLTPDEDLTEIGNMLKAHDEDTMLAEDEIDDLQDGLAQLDILGEQTEGGSSEKKGKKNKKKDNKNTENTEGFMKRISKALFGEDDEDIMVPEAGTMEHISDENMEILKELDGSERKAQKKKEKQAKKEQKEQKKKEKAEKKAEKKAKKEKAPKPPKEKKVKPPKEKTKPLPKLPVFLIFLMVASVVVLIFLSSTLVGYSTGMQQSRQEYDAGDYVQAYQKLRGMKIKEVDQEFYDKTRLTAYVKQELDSYDVYIGRAMYPEALDALILAVGKCDKFLEDATAVGAEGEFGSMQETAQNALMEVFQVTLEEAREIYRLTDRDEYTVRVYELLRRAGYEE